MSAQSRTISVGDIDIHYREEGNGPPLMLLHGGTTTAESWNDALPHLTGRYRVIAPDTRGHGRTTNPAQTMSYAQFADDVAGLIAALGLERPFVLGYSDGGQTALEFGLRHPGKARALVLGGTVSEPTETYLEGLRSWGFTRPGEVDLHALARAFGPYLDQIKTAHAYHYGADYWRSYLSQISRLWLTLPRYSDDQLASISAPTLVIMGDRDELGGLDEASRLYRGIPGAELSIIPDSSHDAVLKPLFWQAVGDFLSRH